MIEEKNKQITEVATFRIADTEELNVMFFVK